MAPAAKTEKKKNEPKNDAEKGKDKKKKEDESEMVNCLFLCIIFSRFCDHVSAVKLSKTTLNVSNVLPLWFVQLFYNALNF